MSDYSWPPMDADEYTRRLDDRHHEWWGEKPAGKDPWPEWDETLAGVLAAKRERRQAELAALSEEPPF